MSYFIDAYVRHVALMNWLFHKQLNVINISRYAPNLSMGFRIAFRDTWVIECR